MTIIAHFYAGMQALDDPLAISSTAFPNNAAQVSTNVSADDTIATFFNVKYTDGNCVDIPCASWSPSVGAVSYNEGQNSKELWARFVWGCKTSSAYYESANNTLLVMYYYTGTRYKIVGKFYVEANVLKFARYTANLETDVIESTVTLVTTNFFLTALTTDAAKNWFKKLDIRYLLDPVAGYIQCYNQDTTLLAEYSGITCATGLKVTHVAINCLRARDATGNSTANTMNVPIFGVAADEPTIGMYVVPLFPKAEGTNQQQDSGTGVSNIAGRVRPANVTPLTLTAANAVTKKYSCKLSDFTDRAVPANYVVKAVKISAIVDGESTKADPLNVGFILKKPSNSAEQLVANAGTVIPNTNKFQTAQYQTMHSTMQLNPLTGLPWVAADFADLEVGVALTGAS